MRISDETQNFIAAVQQYSGNQLQHAQDCELLVEAAGLSSMQDAFAELTFTAKFMHKTVGVMARIGSLGEGYAKLSDEFEANNARAQTLMRTIADAMPDEDRLHFTQTYLAVSAPSFQAMMELVHDLSWIKNYSIDTRAKA